jgi:exosome complex component RRP43
VICGVRGEILPVANIPHYRPRSKLEIMAQNELDRAREMKNYDLLVPNIELATGCAPQFLPGGPPTTLAQTLSTRAYSLLHTCALVDIDDLRIWYAPPTADEDERMAGMGEGEDAAAEDTTELKAYWVLYIDLLFISFDGNPFDAAWAAIVAALKDAKLPKAWWDPDRDMVLCSPAERNKKALNIAGLPLACSAAVFMEKELKYEVRGKHWVLLDPDRLEESLCDEVVTMVLDRSSGVTRIRSLSKNGGTVVGPPLLRKFTDLAEKRWDEFCKVIR